VSQHDVNGSSHDVSFGAGQSRVSGYSFPVEAARVPDGLKASDGLNAQQVAQQRDLFGSNDIIVQKENHWTAVVRDTVRDPMLWFLAASASLFGALGHVGESLILLLAIVPLMGMDFYLHRRTAASSAGLASRMASVATVLRDGQWQQVPSQDLVPGDLVKVTAGEYFPADGVLVDGENLQSDESTLTGEAMPVQKQPVRLATSSETLPQMVTHFSWVWAGTRLLAGLATMRVINTGADTSYGEIVRSSASLDRESTPLQKAIARLVVVLLGVTVVVCALLALIRVWQGYGWIDALLSAVTLAVAAIPEEFPVVYTFFLGAGVYRLSRQKALVRQAVAVENIGRTSCILSDKTGTITYGSLILAEQIAALPQPRLPLSEGLVLQDVDPEAPPPLEVAALAARAGSSDPLDVILHHSARDLPDMAIRAVFPFTEARRRETLVRVAEDGLVRSFTKGAPETIIALCNMSEYEQTLWLDTVKTQATLGRKVIACAWADMDPAIWSQPRGDTDDADEPEQGFRFSGLLAFEDPVREGVSDAVARCLQAGIRVIMVTGDHPDTANAIARSIGLGCGAPNTVALRPEDDPAAVLSGQIRVDVVARAKPAQKLALVKALQTQGELVAVTGDGVNDVPALRQADIGIAMGARGTQSAREIAQVVLLDDNFKTIVQAIAQGHDLFCNLRLAFAYLLLIHIPLVTCAAIVPFLGLPLLLLPVHIVWLELIIHPTAMLAFQESSKTTELPRVSKHRTATFFSGNLWAAIIVLGSLVVVGILAGYLVGLHGADHAIVHARSVAISMLIVSSAGFTAGLTRLQGRTSKFLVAATLSSLVLCIEIPALGALLGLEPLHWDDWMAIVSMLVVTVALSAKLAKELIKAS